MKEAKQERGREARNRDETYKDSWQKGQVGHSTSLSMEVPSFDVLISCPAS
jgi:hypothetical protein